MNRFSNRGVAKRSDNLRRALAQEAARIMAQSGIHDFLMAKRKAATALGVSDDGVLPRNTEIEEALAEYLRLFSAGEHPQQIEAQRRVALQAMHELRQFDPRLVGPVLSGTATEHADVQLHLFADSVEEVVFALLDRSQTYELIERKLRLDSERTRAVPGVHFVMDDQGVEALVFDRTGLRQAPISPVDGRPMRRADADELSRLLQGGTPERQPANR